VGDVRVAHSTLAEGQKFDIRYARCRVRIFQNCYFLGESYCSRRNLDGLHRLFDRLGNRNTHNLRFDSVIATQVCTVATVGMRDQLEQALRHCMAQLTMLRWRGCLLNIDETKFEEVVVAVAETGGCRRDKCLETLRRASTRYDSVAR
jgi:hypothetical protein